MNNRRKILVIDDLEMNHAILQDLLQDEYELLSAMDGKEGIELLNRYQKSISLVLLDIVMPVMDGYEVLRRMHLSDELSRIPVIVMTSINETETELKSLSLGAVDFVTRPYVPAIIKQRIHNQIATCETQRMMNAVSRDILTDSYNEEYFYQRAKEMIGAKPSDYYDLISVDMERFKLFNDVYGMKEGDRLLQYIARKLNSVAAKEDGICARFNADRFMLLYPHHAELKPLVNNIKRYLDRYATQGMKLRLKYGIYHATDSSLSVITMCDRAKLAADQVKGQYDQDFSYYDDSMRRRLIQEQQLTDEMQDALHAGEFEVYLQSKYDLVNNRVGGAEALVRWNHPERGLILPAEFIPFFERNGFITELDLHVWRKTCEILAGLKRQKLPMLPISVNVSRRDFYKLDLPLVLSEMVEEYGLQPEFLHLEITESAYIEDPHHLVETVLKLKKLGFVVEMDDFGTGYSSLNMLTELSIDVLKMDMRFLQSEEDRKSGDRNKNEVIRFVVELAQWMGLKVVAEGVETEEQIALLRAINCQYAQGFYYAKPMPAKLFYEYIEKQSGM